jgi:hypothetical protein
MFNPKSVFFKVLSPVLALAILAPALAIAADEPDCDKSKVQGEVDADIQHFASGWFLGGFGSGVLLGPIGTGIITAVAANSNPQPRLMPDNVDATCYRSGYKGKAKSKNTWAAFGGGLLGTAAFVLIIVAATSGEGFTS